MKPYYHLLLFITFILLLATGCASSMDGTWVKSDGDETRVWLTNADTTLTYRWEGEVFDSVVHGNGILRIISNDSIIEERSAKAYYGALIETDVVSVSDKENYICEISSNKFNGYGVYDKN